MKKLLITLLLSAGVLVQTKAQTARVMAIHNSPDASLSTVDVWLVTPSGNEKLIDDFNFREASGFVNAPAGVDIRVAFAPASSQSIADTLIGFGYNLNANQNYLLMAMGTIGSGYTPSQPFTVKVVTPISERISSGGTAVTIIHGSTDAPKVTSLLRINNDFLSSGIELSYGEDASDVLDNEDYLVDVVTSDSLDLVTTVEANLNSLNLADSALVLFASGFVNPASNNNGASFGIFAALSNGTVIQLPTKNTFRLQVLHNCADPAAASVDVWLTDKTTNTSTKLLSNFEFRKATPFIDAPALKPLAIGIAPPNSTSVNDAIYTEELDPIPGGYTSLAIASGVLTPDSFAANPNSLDINFTLLGIDASEIAAEAGKVQITAFHGVTDAPAVNISIAGGAQLFNNLSFGEESDILLAQPQNFNLTVSAASNNTPVATFSAPLASFADSAITVVASGFLTPTNNKNGVKFGLIAVLPSGNVILLDEVTTGINKTELANSVNVYPNPATSEVFIDMPFEMESAEIFDQQGRRIKSYAKTTELSVDELNKGLYLLNINTNKGLVTKKLIVE